MHLQRLGLNRLAATLVILFGFVVVLALILVLLVPALTHQFAAFIQVLPALLNKLQGLIAAAASKLNTEFATPLLHKLGLRSTSMPDIKTSLNDIAGQAAGWLAGALNSVVSHGAALISLASLLVVTPVVAFYMLLDYHRMIAAVDGLIPPRYRGVVHHLAHQIDTTMSGFLRGQSLVCLFLGLWYGLGLTVVGVNFGLLIGITAGFLSFIPYVGSMTALVAAAIISLVQGWPHWTLFASAMGVVVVGQFLRGQCDLPEACRRQGWSASRLADVRAARLRQSARLHRSYYCRAGRRGGGCASAFCGSAISRQRTLYELSRSACAYLAEDFEGAGRAVR